MSNLKTLLFQPKEYFSGFQGDSIENREPINLKLLFLIYIGISIISGVIQTMLVPEASDFTETFGISGASYIAFQVVGYVVFPIVWAWVCVNVLYLVNKILISGFEDKEILDKKYFKSLLYVRFIGIVIAVSILGIVMSLVIRDEIYIGIAGVVNNLFIKLWAAYMLHGILKYYIGTRKLHIVLPIVLYIFTIIGSVMTIASLLFAASIPM